MQSLHQAWLLTEAPKLAGVLKKHRHVLLAPVFFVLASYMLGSATADVQHRAVTPFATIENGGELDDGTQILDLGSGNALLRKEGLFQFSLRGSGSVTGWNGAIVVLQSKSAVTVVALTTPAIVRMGSGTLIVPSGWQSRIAASTFTATGTTSLTLMRDATPSLLPEEYMAEQRKLLSTLPPARSSVLSKRPSTVSDVLSGKKVDASALIKTRSAFAEALLLKKESLAQTHIRKNGRLLFSGADGQDYLAAALALEVSQKSFRASLLPYAEHRDLRLLLAAHPSIQHEGLLAYEGQARDREALLLSLPLIDTETDPIPQWIAKRLTENLADMIARSRDSLATLKEVLLVLKVSATELSEKGYVNRLNFYMDLANDLCIRYDQVLLDEHRAILADIRSLLQTANEVSSAIAVWDDNASSKKNLTKEAKEQLEVQVRELWIQAGAMLTKDSVIKAQEDGTVRVQNVVIATPKKDELFSFVYDPTTTEVSDILRGSAKYGFGVSIERFFWWLKHDGF